MRLPQLQTNKTSQSGLNNIIVRDTVSGFRGYNHNLVISNDEFYNTTNVSCDEYPVISRRSPRGYLTGYNADGGIFEYAETLFWITSRTYGANKNYLCYTKGYDSSSAEGPSYMDVTSVLPISNNGKRTFTTIGAYIVIMPEKIIFNAANVDRGDGFPQLQYMYEENVTSGNATISPCTEQGTAISAPTTQPTSPNNGDYWLDTGSTPNSLMQWSSASSMWVAMPTTYCSITATNIGLYLHAGDGVSISGLWVGSLDGSYILQSVTNDSLVINGMISEYFVQNTPITVKRTIPDMDFIVECRNRLWGCSSRNHEIYASKLGDPTNWNVFEGLSSDSYAATIGSESKFTGAVAFKDNVIFSKEDRLIKMYGTAPSNFQMTELLCDGIASGSHGSACIINGILYYLSNKGVAAYDGSLPYIISSALGPDMLSNGIAQTAEGKYYLSARDTSRVYHMFVYDPSIGVWTHEDNTKADYMIRWGQLLVYNDSTDKRDNIRFIGRHEYYDWYALSGLSTGTEADFEWGLESGAIGLSLPDHKWVSKIMLRLELARGGKATLSVCYDEGPYEVAEEIQWQDLDSITIPIVPRRCDHMRIKLTGNGEFRLYSITKIVESGSDLNGSY